MSIKAEHKYVLPEPKNPGAEKLVTLMPRIMAGAPTQIDKQQFAVGLMVAANEIKGGEGTYWDSLPKAAFHAAMVGLLPGQPWDLCYFIPRAAKKGQRRVFRLEFGYRGYLKLAFRSSFLESVHCEVVTEKEVKSFKYWNDENGPHLNHDVSDLMRDPNRSNIKAAYCVYKVRQGDRGIELVRRNEIDKSVRDTDPWRQYFARMCCKTAIHRAANYWDVSDDFKIALQLDRQFYADEEQHIPGHEFEAESDVGKKLSLSDIPDDDDSGGDSPPTF